MDGTITPINDPLVGVRIQSVSFIPVAPDGLRIEVSADVLRQSGIVGDTKFVAITDGTEMLSFITGLCSAAPGETGLTAYERFRRRVLNWLIVNGKAPGVTLS